MSGSWWVDFFDAEYLDLWSRFIPEVRTNREIEGLWQLLGLREGSRVLDAPCGYGRISRPLAEKGACVFGVDQSQVLLDRAEQDRGGLSQENLRYLRHDLRYPLTEGGFDAAINIFSSLGYGTEDDDVAILTTLNQAVRPGGFVLIETMHRDLAVANLSRGVNPTSKLPDGTLVEEYPQFDPISGRMETCWSWSGPKGSGKKPASIRVYTATELVALSERAGLKFQSAHAGCSTEPFKAEGEDMGGRIALLAVRP